MIFAIFRQPREKQKISEHQTKTGKGWWRNVSPPSLSRLSLMFWNTYFSSSEETKDCKTQCHDLVKLLWTTCTIADHWCAQTITAGTYLWHSLFTCFRRLVLQHRSAETLKMSLVLPLWTSAVNILASFSIVIGWIPLCVLLLDVSYTAWCSEIGSLTPLQLQLLHASSDVREPISLHQVVLAYTSIIKKKKLIAQWVLHELRRDTIIDHVSSRITAACLTRRNNKACQLLSGCQVLAVAEGRFWTQLNPCL